MSEIFRWQTFEEFSGLDVHDLLKLRQDVFIVEQACAFADIDGLDPQALHLLAFVRGPLGGCLRILDGPELRIGRIVVAPQARGSGLGHRLMAAALERCASDHPGRPTHLSAQAHLKDFYAGHGFIVVSAPYLEDGIPHLDMRREA